MKLEVQTRGAKCITSMEAQLLHQAIEDLRDKTKPWSNKTDELICQLNEEGIEILNSQLKRRNFVIWIWCRSQQAIENIQKLYESNQLTNVLFGLANIRPSTSEITESKLINIDKNQFKKTVGKFY